MCLTYVFALAKDFLYCCICLCFFLTEADPKVKEKGKVKAKGRLVGIGLEGMWRPSKGL